MFKRRYLDKIEGDDPALFQDFAESIVEQIRDIDGPELFQLWVEATPIKEIRRQFKEHKEYTDG